MDEREQLKSMLVKRSLLFNRTQLASGQISDCYVDVRRTSLTVVGMGLIGSVVREEIIRSGVKARALGGLELGAAAVVMAALSGSEDSTLEGFLVRRQPRLHGKARAIEGFCKRGTEVALLEDVTTTGEITVKTINKVLEAGMRPVLLVTLVDREEGALSRVVPFCPFRAVYRLADLIQAHDAEKED